FCDPNPATSPGDAGASDDRVKAKPGWNRRRTVVSPGSVVGGVGDQKSQGEGSLKTGPEAYL
ncbi:MAG TPA: hypothetical protein VHP35_08580, partial [Terriglobia bacterium]|nr:hypothetical protein [Terriglobia bacterium]